LTTATVVNSLRFVATDPMSQRCATLHAMTSALDVRLAPLFHAQHHVVTRAQAMSAGATPRMVERRLTSGRWIAVAPGTYRAAGAPPSWRSDLMAVCLHLGCVASHEAAAALHGLSAPPPPVPVVSVLGRAAHRSDLARVHQTLVLPAGHRTVVDEIPATTVARTLVDLAARIRPARLRRVVDDALVRRLVRYDDLDDAFGALARRGRPGIAAMRELLADHGPGLAMPESELEARVLALLDAHDIPAPVRQAPLPGAGVEGRVDFAWPSARLIVEADGRRWHARFLDFDAGAARSRRVVLDGWRVLPFTWRDVRLTPEVVAAEVRRALRSVAA
jgi:hypothetical protein